MIKLPYLLWRGRFCPIIEVELSYKTNKVRTLAYADTGATYSVFHSDFGEELGLDIHKGKRLDITIGDGGIIPVYLHDLSLRIDELKIKASIGFSSKLGTGINIIGRDGIIDEFMVCFNGRTKEVIWHI